MKNTTLRILISLLSSLCVLTFAGPAMAELQGIDVSKWQGTIDWDVAGDHAGFAIIKAGGSDDGMYTDGQFIRNRDEARRVGIARGYYYYAGGGDPIKEAEHFASLVADLQPGEILALDFEVEHADPVAYVWLFLVRTEELTGTKPLFYTNMNRAWRYDWKPVVDNGNHLWGAIYDGEPGIFPEPGPWPSLAIKQFSNEATVPGINSNVDVNIFPGSIDDFLAMGMPAPVPPVVIVPEPQVPKVAVPETVIEPKQDSRWHIEIQVAEEFDPQRVIAIVPSENRSGGASETYSIQWPSRRAAYIEASYEVDFAAALDS